MTDQIPTEAPTQAPTEAPKQKFDAQAYAARIWAGQSPDLPLRERVDRIKRALTELGVTSFRKLSLPNKEAEKYL